MVAETARGPLRGRRPRLRRAVRPRRSRGGALLPDVRRPRRRAAAAGDGPRWPDDLVGPGPVPAARRTRLLRHPLRQPRHRPLHEGGRPGDPGHAGPGVLRPPGAGAVRPVRHGGRRLRPARPPRARVGPCRGGVDGRDDRPDDGHRAAPPDPVADQHHVDDGQTVGGLAAPEAAAGADGASRPWPHGVRAGQRRDLDADRLAALPQRPRGRAHQGPRDLRPRLVQRRACCGRCWP